MKKRNIVFLLAIFIMVLTPIFKVHAVDTKVEIGDYDESDNNTLLSGAELTILDEKNNTIVDKWTTDGDLKDIKTYVEANKTYKIHQITPPKGYTLSDDVNFTVVGNEDEKYTITNKKINLTINKVDEEGNNITGSLLELYELDGDEPIDSWVSNGTGHTVQYSKLEYGKTYRLVETKLPAGYMAYELTKEFTIYEEENVINFENREINVTIANYDENNEQLSGVKLQIEDSKGQVVEEAWVSNGDFHSVNAKLEVGEIYNIVEVEVPKGYVRHEEPVSFTVTNSINQSYKVQNSKFSITVETMDQNDKAITGVKFKVYKDAEELFSFESDGSKLVLTDDNLEQLTYGETYRIVATEVPDGYILENGEQTFTINEEKLTITSVFTKVSIKISKYDEDNVTPVEGATIKLLDSNNNLVEEWTTDSNPHEVTKPLKSGETYTIREESAPNGYVKAADKTFQVTNDKVQNYSITDGRIHISVLKTDEDDQPLAGALLELIEKDENGENEVVIDSWTSTTEKYEIPFDKIKKINLDKKHYIRETTPPTGYEKISNDTLITITLTTDEQLHKLSNNPERYEASISILENDNAPVVGATLELYEGTKVTGEPIATWQTTNEPKKFSTIEAENETKLKYGKTYTLHEKSVPAGYISSDDVTFKLDEKLKQVKITNKKVNLKVTIENENKEALIGATLVLKDGADVLDTWTVETDKNHEISAEIISEMSYDKEYTIHETTTPNGYIPAEDVDFKLSDYDEEMVDGLITIEMNCKKFNVSVNMLDESGNNLEGATLHIEDSNGTKIGEGWTTTEGSYNVPSSILSQLGYGVTYYIVETIAPDGHTVSNEKKAFTINDESIEVPFYNFDSGIYIINYDEGGYDLLAGTKLQIIDKEAYEDAKEISELELEERPSYVVDEWLTNEEPHKITEELEIGKTYIVHVETPTKGHVFSKDFEFTKNDEEPHTYSVINEKVRVAILKVDEDDKPLVGAQLSLYEEGDNASEPIVSWTSTERAYVLTDEKNAEIDVTKKHYIIEVESPEGYVKLPAIKLVDIKDNDSELQVITIQNQLETYKVKVDVLAEEELEDTNLSNIELELYIGTDLIEENKIASWTANGNPKEFSTTTTDGENKLKYGETYTIHIKSVPNGYIPTKDEVFVVGEDSFEDIEENEVSFKEKTINLELERFNIKITKTGKNDEKIAGATFEVLNSTGESLGTFETTGGEYVVSTEILNKIHYGDTIKVREIKAPTGYIKSSEVKTIEINNKDNEVVFANVELGVNIANYGVSEGTYLVGTKLQILDADKTKVIDEWTTTDNQTHNVGDKLVEGEKYYIHVEEPANGYIIPDDVSFTVTNEQSQLYKIVNQKFDIEILKVDETDEPLAGALLGLYEEGSENPIDTWTSETTAHKLTEDKLSQMNIKKNYFVRETTAPAGYKVANEQFISIKNETDVQTFKITNSLKEINIYINAVDEGNNNIEGAEIELYEGDGITGTKITSWTSTTSSKNFSTIKDKFDTSKLEYGKTYTIHVVRTPSGKEISSDIVFTIDDNFEEEKYIYILAERYTLKISKLDEKGEPLAGATLQVLSSDGTKQYDEFVSTTEPHVVKTDEIPFGSTIKIIEVDAPAGYVRSPEEKIVVIDKNEIHVTFANVELGVNIANYDEDGHTYLKDTVLELLDENKDLVESWTTEEAFHAIENPLKEGKKYYIHVKTPSDGHIIPNDKEFTITNDKTQTYDIINPRIKLQVKKLDENGDLLAGAFLQIKEVGSTEPLYKWTSKESVEVIPYDNVISKMNINKSYVVEETQPPAAYQQLTSAQPLVMINTAEMQTTTIQNNLKPITLSISVRHDNTKLLTTENMMFELYLAKNENGKWVKDGASIAQWSTDDKMFYTVKPNNNEDNDPVVRYGNTYIIHEVKAANGYVTTDDEVVLITDVKDGVEGNNLIEVNINNDLLDVRIENEIKGPETSGRLAGAKLELYKGTDTSNPANRVEVWETTEGLHAIKALLEAGATYTIHEVEVPDGYDISPDVSFTVKNQKEEQVYKMITNEHPLDVRIRKINERDEALNGAEFELYTIKKDAEGNYEVDENGKYIKDEKIYEWTSSAKSDQTGCSSTDPTEDCGYHQIPVHISDEIDLHVGYYIVHEEVYPIPYQPKDEDSIDTLIEVKLTSKPQLWTVVNRDTITTVVINKVDRDCSKEDDELCHITGAKLHIEDVTDPDNVTIVESWTSDGEPHTVYNKLVPGRRYVLVEEIALVDANQAYQKSEDLDLGVIKNIEEPQVFTMYTDRTIVKAIFYNLDEFGEHLPSGKYKLIEGEFGNNDPLDILKDTPCEEIEGCVVEWDAADDEDAHDISEYVRVGYTYTIVQTKEPYGYKPFDGVSIVVGYDDITDEEIRERVNSSVIYIDNITYVEEEETGIQIYNILNEKKDITLEINNFGSDEMFIIGSAFELLDPDGNVIDKWESDGTYHVAINGEEKNYKFEVGATYTIHQLSVPTGYLIDQEYYEKEIEDTEENQTVDIQNSKLLTLTIHVIDEKNQYLPGVVMQILDKDGKVKAQWKTGDTFYSVAELPAPATYIVRQKTVPDKYAKESDQYIMLDPNDEFPVVTIINYEKKVLDNPDTLDDIIKYVAIGISALIAVIIGILIYKKANKSKG